MTVFDEITFCRRLIGAVNIEKTSVMILMVGQRSAKCRALSPMAGIRILDQRNWNIGLQTAKDTLAATTQHGVRTAVQPMSRRLRNDHPHLHSSLICGKWYADTLLSKVKSIRGNTCANVFTQGNFTKVVPMIAQSDAGKLLVDFTDDVGIPERLVTDGEGEFTGKGKQPMKEARRTRIQLHTIKQGQKNHNNAAEHEIGFLAKRWKLRIQKKRLPKRLWDFGLVVESEILTRMAPGQDRRLDMRR